MKRGIAKRHTACIGMCNLRHRYTHIADDLHTVHNAKLLIASNGISECLYDRRGNEVVCRTLTFCVAIKDEFGVMSSRASSKRCEGVSVKTLHTCELSYLITRKCQNSSGEPASALLTVLLG